MLWDVPPPTSNTRSGVPPIVSPSLVPLTAASEQTCVFIASVQASSSGGAVLVGALRPLLCQTPACRVEVRDGAMEA